MIQDVLQLIFTLLNEFARLTALAKKKKTELTKTATVALVFHLLYKVAMVSLHMCFNTS